MEVRSSRPGLHSLDWLCLYKGKRIRFAMIQFRADGAQYADLGFMRANQEGFCV